jgi:two-component system LytT family response regulator
MDVWIIEDEAAAARRLEKLLLEIEPTVKVAAVLDSVEAVLSMALQGPLPDLLFMDIHLADGSSFEIFKHMEVRKPIIFITAYDQYAIEAFSTNGIDYLLKPIEEERLAQALEKLKKLKKICEMRSCWNQKIPGECETWPTCLLKRN